MSDSSVDFIHLRVRSAYSLLRGAIRIPQTIDFCQSHNMPAIAISDHDNLFGSLEFSEAAVKAGVQPIIATTLSMVPLHHSSHAHLRPEETEELLIIAKNQEGYDNLLKLSSASYVDPAEETAPYVSYQQLYDHKEGLIVLTGGMLGGVGKALLTGRRKDAEALLLQLKEHFPQHLYVELMRHGLAEEKQVEPDVIRLGHDHDIPLVATNNAYFVEPKMYDAHDALLCVAYGRYVSEDDRPRLTREHRLKTPQEMKLLFADVPEALENSVRIAQRCSVFSPARAPILPGFHVQDKQGAILTESDALRKRAEEGLEARLEAHVYTEEMTDAEKEAAAKPYRERLEYELDVIITMKFPGYFLIVSDFITWAKEQEIPVGPGRGSGAGSVVAWVLLITDLDPLKFGLIFERFLNPERVSMPDFDIDFCQDRRDEVIRYVQQKYGHDKVAQIITFGKLQARAVLRDVGRVLQMPYGQVDRICKLVPNNPANPVTLKQAIDLEPDLKKAIREDEAVDQLVTLSLQLEGLYRHASTHAAGVVIGDRALEALVPLYRDPKSDMPVVQYSMKYAEAAGLVKFDFLGLKTLTVIQKTLKFLERQNIHIDLATLPFDDEPTYELLTKGVTVGVFQFESAGMQDALRKLKPDCLEDLIALGALYRPGPMDNIPTYIARKHGKEEPDYLHDMLEEVLKETYGVIIYQEQVQKIAQIMAGYTLGGADLLRRAMGKKIKAEMDKQRETFVEGAKKNGVSQKQSSGIFDLVAKFAGYGFNKSHAAAYAVIAYQTAYLKANYPVEFLAASMTYDMHATDKLSIFKQEAEKLGVAVLPPDINASEPLFNVEIAEDGTKSIRYALAAIKNVGEHAMQALVNERDDNGSYKNMYDFCERTDSSVMNRRQLENLILSGSFDSMNGNRKQLHESIDLLLGISSQATQERESNQVSLFGMESDSGETHHPPLKPTDDWMVVERLSKEFDAVGFYLSAHPLQGYADLLASMRVTGSHQLDQKLGREYGPVKMAGIITGKKVKVSDRGKFAFLQLTDEFGLYEASIFDEALLNNTDTPLENGQMVVVHAEGKRDEGGARIIAKGIELLDKSAERFTLKEVQFHVSDMHSLNKFKQLLGDPKEKATKVLMTIVLDKERWGKITLPECYQLDPQVIVACAQLPGVERVS